MTRTVPATNDGTTVVNRLRHLYDHRMMIPFPALTDFDLIEAGWVGINVIDGYRTWWLTTAATALISDVWADVTPVPTPPEYRVTWRQDGVAHGSDRGLTLTEARQVVDGCVALLREARRMSAITVVDERLGDVVTAAVAGDLIPSPPVLAGLLHRADVIQGLRDAADYYISQPGVLVPRRVHLMHRVEEPDPQSARTTVLVAAAALGVDPDERLGGAIARRDFGPVAVGVEYVDAAAYADGGDR